MNILRRTIIVLLMAAGCVQLTGCAWSANLWDSWFGHKKPYELRIHRFSTRMTQENENNKVEYLPGRFIYLDPTVIVSSKDMRKITISDHPGGNGKSLSIVLDGHGRAIWTQLTATLRGQQVVCMLDGDYMGPIEIEKLNELGTFTIPGPFTDEEAEKIVEKAPNFR